MFLNSWARDVFKQLRQAGRCSLKATHFANRKWENCGGTAGAVWVMPMDLTEPRRREHNRGEWGGTLSGDCSPQVKTAMLKLKCTGAPLYICLISVASWYALAAHQAPNTIRNHLFGFCISYPSNFSADNSRTGVELVPPGEGMRAPSAEWRARIRIVGFDYRPAPTLEEQWTGSFEALKSGKGWLKAANVRLLEKKSVTVLKWPAIQSVIRYNNPKGEPRILKEVITKSDAGVLYFFELHTTPDRFKALEPVLQDIVGSFRFCSPASIGRLGCPILPPGFGGGWGVLDGNGERKTNTIPLIGDAS